MADDPRQRLFWWFFRPFLGKRALPVPEGVTDEELVRKGEEAPRRPWNLLLECLLCALLAWGVVRLHGDLGLGAVRRPEDLHFETSTPWFGAVFMAMGLTFLVSVSPLAWLIGTPDDERERVSRLAFEARHKVNVRHALALLGALVLATGAAFVAFSDDYVAFDRQTLRWRHLYAESSRPIADIAEVRWYLRKETPRGGPRKWNAACVLFKDGSRWLSTDGLMSLGMTPEACARLAEVAGVPAKLDLDLLPLER